MPEYHWKLTIVERNVMPTNWINLIPEAQERILEEAEELMRDLSLPDRRRLLTALERLQNHIEEYFQPKIQQILSSQLSMV
ncbi:MULTISPECIES: hypothetical protein [unclassified Coleofasciculus]|uniref:hypothetical protein n=1 Tax=unclassified Coleofasciculus TaxID=2692782 RepID=UPI00187E5D10|nr:MULTISPECIES: hypothetical protein [unclassified Coleofasciculus]MBE9129038.1 hypothetical protein [Coleofasciculus sp. LEGE 07081]MBE9151639.1 hypothetical protein [Coleofasciculus sp. LEGE 07092]